MGSQMGAPDPSPRWDPIWGSETQLVIGNPINQPFSTGEGKRPYFAERHDLRNGHNYAGCTICRMIQRNMNMFPEQACYIPHNYTISQVIPHAMSLTHYAFYPHPLSTCFDTKFWG